MVWTDNSATADDSSGTAVRGQFLNADGSKSGSEFLINTTTAGSQGDPDIVALPNGGFAVVWTDGSQTGADASGDAVRGQFFNPDGTKAGSELLINTTTAANQHTPSVATLADGRISIVWDNASRSAPYTSSDAVRGQIFNPDGTKAGSELPINTVTELHQNNPSVVALADGRFATFWMQNTTETPPPPLGASDTITDVVAQIFNADGTQFGGEFRVNSHITPIYTDSGPRSSMMLGPSAVLLDDGRFVVAWVGIATGRGGPMHSGFCRLRSRCAGIQLRRIQVGR